MTVQQTAARDALACLLAAELDLVRENDLRSRGIPVYCCDEAGTGDCSHARAAYHRRNTAVVEAVSMAMLLGFTAGFGVDPGNKNPIVAYIDLPTGQVSWHLPAYPGEWDEHTTNEKYARIAIFGAEVESRVHRRRTQ